MDERDEKAKQYGADEQAKQSQTYNGKIIKSNDKISLQETKNGIVLQVNSFSSKNTVQTSVK